MRRLLILPLLLGCIFAPVAAAAEPTLVTEHRGVVQGGYEHSFVQAGSQNLSETPAEVTAEEALNAEEVAILPQLEADKAIFRPVEERLAEIRKNAENGKGTPQEGQELEELRQTAKEDFAPIAKLVAPREAALDYDFHASELSTTGGIAAWVRHYPRRYIATFGNDSFAASVPEEVIETAARLPSGEWVDLGPPEATNETTQQVARDPSVAMDAAGNATVVWAHVEAGSWVVSASIRPAGGPWGPVKRLSTIYTESAREATVTVEGETATVTWHDFASGVEQSVSYPLVADPASAVASAVSPASVAVATTVVAPTSAPIATSNVLKLGGGKGAGPASVVSSKVTVRGKVTAAKLVCRSAASCKGTVGLTISKKRIIGTATFSIPAGKAAVIRVKLNGLGRALFLAGGHLSATLTVL